MVQHTKLSEMLKVQIEDRERLNGLLTEIGDIIARSNTVGLELDWQYFCEQMFADIVDVDTDEDTVPEIWYTVDVSIDNNGY